MSTVRLSQQTMDALQTLANWWGIDLDLSRDHFRFAAEQHPVAFAQVMESLAASIRRDPRHGTDARIRAAIKAEAEALAAGRHPRARP